MVYRIIAVLACTVLSFYGVFWPLWASGEIFTCLAGGPCQIKSDAKDIFTIIAVIIFSTAWFFYFIICYSWIRTRPIPKKTRILGATFGCTSILMTVGLGLFFTFPSVGLMIHIHRTVPYKKINLTRQ
jgi:hypothetical protein